jgi:coproporphyrinogen III oxidase-like Fe-S oxidoreductase
LNPFYGFGIGATSLINNYRFARPNNISKYQKYVNLLKNGGECPKGNLETNFLKLELFIMGKLRTSEGIDLNSLSIEIREIIDNMFEEKANVYDKYVILQENKLRLKIPEGYLVCDEILTNIIRKIEEKLDVSKIIF